MCLQLVLHGSSMVLHMVLPKVLPKTQPRVYKFKIVCFPLHHDHFSMPEKNLVLRPLHLVGVEGVGRSPQIYRRVGSLLIEDSRLF